MKKEGKAQEKRKHESTASSQRKGSSLPSIPAVEALSFLRETRGVSTWTARDMATSLKIRVAEVKQVIAVMEMQGYVNQFKGDEWMTTFAGETVSGSKPPRYTRERIEKALSELSARIEETNRDVSAPYKIKRAVAFGDFLSDRTRLQAAEVGISLEERILPTPGAHAKGKSAVKNRKPEPAECEIAPPPQRENPETQKQFLNRLRGKGGILHVTPYEDWMAARSHRDLMG